METKIYFACLEPLHDERIFAQLYAMASDERREKTDRFHFQKDRIRSIGAEGLLLHAMREAGLSRRNLIYEYGKEGKPYLPGKDGFFFNISHSGDYVMLAVSDAEIGCDIEQIRPVEPGLIRLVLDDEEQLCFAACHEEERDSLFCRYWVLKESYLKATGRGLYLNPRSIRIKKEPSVCVIRDGLPQKFGFLEGDDIPGYRWAVCREGKLSGIQTEYVQLQEIAEPDH